MAGYNFPENNLQKKDNFRNLKAKDIDFVNRFSEGLTGFATAIGISRLLPVQQGFTIKMYGAPKVTLADGTVEEGALIPLSKVEPVEVAEKTIELKKYRKATTGEAIQKYGFDNAIELTDAALIKEINKNVRKDLFDTIQSGSAKANLKAGTLQGALATAWGALQVVFEDDAVSTVVFAHPEDIAKQIADKALTLETQFGLQYYVNATGTIVFSSSQVAKGTIYATAPENLNIAYIDPNSSELGKAFDLTTDEYGFVGATHFLSHETLTHQTLVVGGVLIFPERVDGVVKVEIGVAGV